MHTPVLSLHERGGKGTATWEQSASLREASGHYILMRLGSWIFLRVIQDTRYFGQGLNTVKRVEKLGQFLSHGGDEGSQLPHKFPFFKKLHDIFLDIYNYLLNI